MQQDKKTTASKSRN